LLLGAFVLVRKARLASEREATMIQTNRA